MFVDHTFRPVGVMAAAAMTASGTFGTESELDTLGTEPLSGEPQTGSRASIGFVTRPAVGAGLASFRRVSDNGGHDHDDGHDRDDDDGHSDDDDDGDDNHDHDHDHDHDVMVIGRVVSIGAISGWAQGGE